MKKPTVKYFALLIITAIALSVTGCFSPYMGDEGTITINMGGARAAAWTKGEEPIVLGDLDFTVTMTGPGTPRTLTGKGSDSFRATVPPGLWTVKIDASYGGIPFATGSNTVDVKAGQSNPVIISMEETEFTFLVARDAEEWNGLANLMGDPGNYVITVTADIDGAGPLSISGGGGGAQITAIIRGGYTVSLDTGWPGSLLTVGSFSSVTLIDTDLVGISGNDRPLVTVEGDDGASLFTMQGSASVRDNKNGYRGGGVYVCGEFAFFTMTGGAISGNTANEGGGVYVEHGNFTMSGGTIGNGNTAVRGGGVFVASGTFTMRNGTISGNTATGSGGGVHVNVTSGAGTMSMHGGTISGNTATGNGGGVYVCESNFAMSGGTIGGGNSATRGGGVYVDIGSFTMSGSAVISGNTAASQGGGVFVNGYSGGGTMSMHGGTITGNAASKGRSVYSELNNKVSLIDGSPFPLNEDGGMGADGFYTDSDIRVSNGAIVEPAVYTVTFASNGGSAVAPIGNLLYGAAIAAPANPTTSAGGATMNTFRGWYRDNGTFAVPWDFTTDTVTGNTTLYADWGYRPGDDGPGGGIVFYRSDAGFTVQMIDPSPSYTAYYLEAAPADLAGTHAWASSGFESLNIEGTGTAIGTGKRNTDFIIYENPTAPAANGTHVYSTTLSGVTIDDWFLPSREELNQLWLNRSSVGNMGIIDYWSSSQNDATRAWSRYFGDGSEGSVLKNIEANVRPVRAF